MDVPANGWASRSNGWMFSTNGWVSRSNGWTFLLNGWASYSNGWMLLPNGWASHSNDWTFLSNGWSSRSNGCKFLWTDDPGRSNACKFLSNGFQTGSKRNSVRKRKAVIARFRVKGHNFVLSLQNSQKIKSIYIYSWQVRKCPSHPFLNFLDLSLEHTVPLKSKLTLEAQNLRLDPASRSSNASSFEMRGSSLEFRWSRIEDPRS